MTAKSACRVFSRPGAVEAAGGVAIPGIEMFLTQAAEQLALFTGTRPSEVELGSYVAGVV